MIIFEKYLHFFKFDDIYICKQKNVENLLFKNFSCIIAHR